MPRLKPCPFCGGEVVMHSVSAKLLLLAEMGQAGVPPMIHCTRCGALVSFDDAKHTGMTISGVRKLWNRRDGDPDAD